MKNIDLLNAMNDIDGEYIRAAEEGKRRRNVRMRRVGVGMAAAACVCLAAVGGMYALKHPNVPWDEKMPEMTGNAGNEAEICFPEKAKPESGEAAKSEETAPGGGSDSEQSSGMGNGAEYVIVRAQYPECVVYPSAPDSAEYDRQLDAYYKQRAERREQQEACSVYQESLYPFYEKTMQQLLISEESKNRAYSPLNLYMALSMLAELAGGNSRAQLLALLNAQGIDAVRESAAALWNANYAADGILESRLANSVWLKQGIDFVPETVQRLADIYHASAFRGDMASPEFTGALQQWLNEQTGGLLREQAAGIELKKETLLALASTVYFRAQWSDRFGEEDTKEGIFHAASGEMVCDFMNQQKEQYYYWGSNFSAICKNLDFSGGMWLMLPDEGVSVNDMLQNKEILRLVRESYQWKDSVIAKVNLSMPKFDIASDLDLKEGLMALGVTDVFDGMRADFTPLAAQSGEMPYLSEAKHAARVMVDEEGCSAAAFTVLAGYAGGMLQNREEIDFVLDRPFVFAITGEDGSLLFMGVVEDVKGQ